MGSSTKQTSITEGQAMLLGRLLAGWDLSREPRGRWMWTSPEGREEPNPHDVVKPMIVVNRGWIRKIQNSHSVGITRRGRTIAADVGRGKLRVIPSKTSKTQGSPLAPSSATRMPGTLVLASKPEVCYGRTGRCKVHAKRMARCTCGVCFCPQCDGGHATCSFCRSGDAQYNRTRNDLPMGMTMVELRGMVTRDEHRRNR